MDLVKEFRKDQLKVEVYDNRDLLGQYAAKGAIEALKKALEEKEEVNVIFAAAPSQSEFLATLTGNKDIDWERVNALHLDEYIGLEKEADQLFVRFLTDNVFSKANFKNVFTMDFSEGNVKEEISRYSDLIEKYPIDIAFIGIGENGHIAFNDPPVADFEDEKLVKEVQLDNKCRQQQVNDKCFEKIDDVPLTAATVTIPAIMRAKNIFCMVPAITKAEAVDQTINGEITTACPASILRRHPNTTLYLDRDSASKIL